MLIADIFQMNDLEIKKFLRIVGALNLATWGSIGFTMMSIDLPIVRELCGFLFISFVPGIVMLRVLRLHRLGGVVTILLSVGLSLTMTMILGALTNLLYPRIGIDNPLSLWPFLCTMSVAVLTLCILAYARDRDFCDPSYLNTREFHTPSLLLLWLIVLMTIIGVFSINTSGNSVPMLVLLLCISLMFVLVSLKGFFPVNMYPVTILVLSISLLWHDSLISSHVCGVDLQFEYFTSNQVLIQGYWNPSTGTMLNGMLSLVVLAPAYSQICGMNLVEVFKVVYPMLFSLVPLGMYTFFRKQLGSEKVAILSIVFFISIITFFQELVALARQEVGELFLVLVILLIMDKRFLGFARSLLLLVFGFSLVVSHYGVSYFFMLILPVVLLLNWNDGLARKRLSGRFVAYYSILAISWYAFIAGAASFVTAVGIANHISDTFLKDFLSPGSAQGIAIITQEMNSIPLTVVKYMHIFAQLLIVVGYIHFFRSRHDIATSRLYFGFSSASLAVMIAAIAVPYFASSFNTTRLYHISLIFLAPLCVIGGMALVDATASKLIRTVDRRRRGRASVIIMSLFFAAFFLFNAGFVNMAVGRGLHGSMYIDASVDGPRFNDQEVSAATWIFEVRDNEIVYGDAYRWLLLSGIGWGNAKTFPPDLNQTPIDSYVFLGSRNVLGERFVYNNQTGESYSDTAWITMDRIRILDDGGAQIFR